LIAELFGLAGMLAFATLGALIVTRSKERRIGWLYCAIGLVSAIDTFSGVYAIMALLMAPGSLPAGLVFAWIQSWTWLVVVGLLFVLLPLLYPTGRPLSRRWRLVAVCALGLYGGGTVLATVEPGRLGNYLTYFPVAIANPLGIAALGPAYPVIVPIVLLLLLLLILVAAASLLLRLRRSRGDERAQLKWFAYVIAFLIAQFVVMNLLTMSFPHHPLTHALIAASNLVVPFIGVMLPILTGLAILKYRLYDIDLLINRTLVYGALSACVVGLYVLVVGGLGVLLQTQGSLPLSILATGLVALLFQPLRARLQQAVNRLMYGERADPHAVIARLNQQFATALSSDTLLVTMARSIREGLKLSYVGIALRQDQEFVVVTASGTALGKQVSFPVLYQNEVVADLIVAARGAGENFSALDQRALEDLCAPVGVAVHAVRVTTDLQRSRAQLVTAREEERRRLRRDLHDGLGPALGGLLLKLDALGDELRCDPTQAAMLLGELKVDVQAAVADVRRLVYALRPPALDELGLVGALRLLATQYERPDLCVDVAIPDDLPALPAAVEVAVYRIAHEALTNVIRHALASACVLTLAAHDRLELSVSDNGQGIVAQQPLGVGLISMRERANELGGECAITSESGKGVVVRAWLPLPGTPRQEAVSLEQELSGEMMRC
jgi:signal transduction histidine kinase